MGEGSTAGDPAVAAAFRRTGLTVRGLWFRCLALGGNADEVALEAQLCGLMALPPGEYNVVAHALNEALDELPDAAGGPRVPYLGPLSLEGMRQRLR